MALEVKLSKVGVNDAGTEYYLTDATGVYQAASGIEFTAIGGGSTNLAAVNHGLITGTIVTLATTDTLPSPLQVNTQYSAILVNATTFQLATPADPTTPIAIDDTGIGTHTFISGVNLGGYGNPNPERSSVALILATVIKYSTGDVVATTQAYDPETVVNWTLNIEDKDGVYESTLFALNKKTGSETTGDVVYDSAVGEVQKYNGTTYDTLTDLQLIAEDNPGIDSDTYNGFIVVGATAIKNTINKELTEALKKYTQKLCDYETVFAKQNDYNYVRTLLEGGILQFCRGNYTLAQENIEALETYYNAL